MKLKISARKKFGKLKSILILNNTFFSNLIGQERNKRHNRKYFKMNENKL